MLRDLVTAHRGNPSARFVREGQGPAVRPACPRLLRLEPDHGPVEGG
ncbi:hypothetical protein GCM10010435_68900 [Winogradskya consettensis]|uniref:Uncharacterized protein n=1 Tax=Winogradskya consettensis TaxID=113560 RepID=A0A919SK60_9ACTN|nr:hypothetical protein [Actinoplanes consettensis]GIM73561.1 hypothetical protein Aco04nite_35880 [Actinoplanes consettensis]